jgi:hypothetical protein
MVASDPTTFSKLISAELKQWRDVVQKAQIKAE